MKGFKGTQPDKPRTLRTDKYEIKIYPNSRKIYFYRLDIKLGEVIPRKSPQFILDLKEYEHYTDVLGTIRSWLASWTGVSEEVLLRKKPPMRKPDPNYRGDGREYIVQGKI